MTTDRLRGDGFTGITQLIDSQLPTTLIKRPNPLFERQIQQLSRPLNIARLRRFTYIGVLIAVLVTLPTIMFLSSRYWVDFVGHGTLIATGLSLLADIVYMVVAINSTVPQTKDGQWELLRLTSLTETDILMATYATIQIRVWRATVIDTAVRGVVSLMALAYFGYCLSIYSAGGVSYITQLLVPMVTTIGFILEPLWRMRTITLLAMTTATWFRDYGIAVVVTFVGVILLLMVELIVVLLLGIIISVLPTLSYASSTLGIIFFVVRVAVFMVGFVLFFKGVNTLIFRRLLRAAFPE